MSLNLTGWTRPDRGALFVVTGASGTGKTTLVREALARVPDVGWSVSMTTRPPRAGEKHGFDYYFVSQTEFDEALLRGDLLEWAQVYGNRYGTPRQPVLDALSSGHSILLEIDAQGAAQVHAALPEAVLIFVLPPSLDAIEARLRARSTDSEEVIARRVADAKLQLAECGHFDYLIVNEDLASAHDQFQAVLISELRRTSRNPGAVARFAP